MLSTRIFIEQSTIYNFAVLNRENLNGYGAPLYLHSRCKPALSFKQPSTRVPGEWTLEFELLSTW